MTLSNPQPFDKDNYTRFRLKRLEHGIAWLWIALVAQGFAVILLSVAVFVD